MQANRGGTRKRPALEQLPERIQSKAELLGRFSTRSHSANLSPRERHRQHP